MIDDEDMDFGIDSETPPKTPPGSPIIGYAALRASKSFNADEYCLDCKGSIRSSDVNFSPNSLLAKGELTASLKILNKNLSLEESFDESSESVLRYKFFNFLFDPTPEKLQVFVKICRKNVSMLENSVQHSLDAFNTFDLRHSSSDGDLPGSQSSWNLRKDVCNFLNFVVKNEQSFKTVEDFMQVFKGFQKSLPRFEAWPASLKNHGGSNDGNKCLSACYHYFHLHLELRWFFVILSNASPPVIRWILEDLVHLAWFKYTTEKMNEWSSKGVNKCVAFNCYCVKELWTMMRHVLDEMKPQGKDFWDLLTNCLNSFEAKGDDLLFPLWLVTNIAPLKNYNFKGKYSDAFTDQNTDCYYFVRETVKDLVNQNQKITEAMHLLYSLLPYWGADVGIIQVLWNFWVNKINRSAGFEYNYWKSPEKWIALLKSLIPSAEEASTAMDQSSAVANDEIFPFIKLLCGHIQHFPKDKKIQKLTGLIYLKLPESKCLSFGELGLIRLSTLHLATIYAASDDETVALCKPFMDCFHKLFEEFTKLNKQASVRTVLTAQVTMFLLLLDKGISVESLAPQLMKQVSNLMLRETKLVIDSNKRELIMVYLEFLDCLPKLGSQLDLGQAELVSTNFPVWLKCATPDYLNRAFRVFHNLLTWLFPENQFAHLVQKIYDCSKDVLKTLVYTKISKSGQQKTDLEPLVDLAADFTYFHRYSPAALKNFFDTFALDVKINVEISQLYLEKIMDSYGASIINDDLKLLQAWIRLTCFGVPVPSKLTCAVMNNMNTQVLFEYSCDTLLRDFCDCAKDNWDKTALENILQPVTDVCRHKWTPYKDNLESIEAIIGSTSTILSSLKFSNNIYVPRMPCVAKTILDFYSNFWVNITDELGVIWAKTLPDVFTSIISFHPYENDPYLLRQVQTIVNTAFVGFAGSDHMRNVENHPAVKIMKYAVDFEAIPALDYLAQMKFNQTDQKSNPAGDFLKTLSLFSRRNVGPISVILYALPTVLRIVRLSVSGQEMSSCVELFCSLFDPTLTADVSPFILERKVTEAVEAEVGPNMFLNYRKYFKLFENMAKSKCSHRVEVRKYLSDKLIPLIREQIKLCQMQRGTGQNNSLWNALEQFEAELNRSF